MFGLGGVASAGPVMSLGQFRAYARGAHFRAAGSARGGFSRLGISRIAAIADTPANRALFEREGPRFPADLASMAPGHAAERMDAEFDAASRRALAPAREWILRAEAATANAASADLVELVAQADALIRSLEGLSLLYGEADSRLYSVKSIRAALAHALALSERRRADEAIPPTVEPGTRGRVPGPLSSSEASRRGRLKAALSAALGGRAAERAERLYEALGGAEAGLLRQAAAPAVEGGRNADWARDAAGGFAALRDAFRDAAAGLARGAPGRGHRLAELQVLTESLFSRPGERALLEKASRGDSLSAEELRLLTAALVDWIELPREAMDAVRLESVRPEAFEETWAREKLRALSAARPGRGWDRSLLDLAAVVMGRADNRVHEDQGVGLDVAAPGVILAEDRAALKARGFSLDEVRRAFDAAELRRSAAGAEEVLEEQAVFLDKLVDVYARHPDADAAQPHVEALTRGTKHFVLSQGEGKPRVVAFLHAQARGTLQGTSGYASRLRYLLNNGDVKGYLAAIETERRDLARRRAALTGLLRRIAAFERGRAPTEAEALVLNLQLVGALTPSRLQVAHQDKDELSENADPVMRELFGVKSRLNGDAEGPGVWDDFDAALRVVSEADDSHRSGLRVQAFRTILAMARAGEGMASISDRPLGIRAVFAPVLTRLALGGIIREPQQVDERMFTPLLYLYHDLKFHLNIASELRRALDGRGVAPARFWRVFLRRMNEIDDPKRRARVELMAHILFHDFPDGAKMIREREAPPRLFAGLSIDREQVVARMLKQDAYGGPYGPALLPRGLRGLSNAEVDAIIRRRNPPDVRRLRVELLLEGMYRDFRAVLAPVLAEFEPLPPR